MPAPPAPATPGAAPAPAPPPPATPGAAPALAPPPEAPEAAPAPDTGAIAPGPTVTGLSPPDLVPRARVPGASEPAVVQAVGATDDGSAGTRTYGDGGGEDLSWNDPEIDLRPRGRAHFVLGGHGEYLGGTTNLWEAGSGGLRVQVDVCLEPSLSLHLRFGAGAAWRTLTDRTTPLGHVRSALLVVRGGALLGVHLWQLFALRAGFEVGSGFDFSLGDGLGFALLTQIGIRVAGGSFELGAELGVDGREAILRGGVPATSQEAAPRVGGYAEGTF